MKTISTIGLDLTKNIFRVYGVNANGRCVVSKNIHRDSLAEFFAKLPACVVAMEACGTSHYWGRCIASYGHTVKIIHPRYVAPFRIGGKNDANDAAAICEAAQRPHMRFVALKSQREADIQSIHRVRQGLVKERTATANRIRALLLDNGIAVKQGIRNICSALPAVLGDEENALSGLMRNLLGMQYEHFIHLEKQIKQSEDSLKKLAADNNLCQRLRAVPGIGLLTATSLLALEGVARDFKKSRSFAAFLGLTPRQHSEVVPIVRTGFSGFLACLFPYQAAFKKASW